MDQLYHTQCPLLMEKLLLHKVEEKEYNERGRWLHLRLCHILRPAITHSVPSAHFSSSKEKRERQRLCNRERSLTLDQHKQSHRSDSSTLVHSSFFLLFLSLFSLSCRLICRNLDGSVPRQRRGSHNRRGLS